MKTTFIELVTELLKKTRHLKPRERATFVTPEIIFTVVRDSIGRFTLLCDVGYNKLDGVEIDEESLLEAQALTSTLGDPFIQFGSSKRYH